MRLLTVIAITGAWGCAHAPAGRASSGPSIVVTVDSNPGQTFGGLGANMASETSTGWATPATPEAVQEMSNQIWRDCHMTSARIWMDPATYEPSYGEKHIDNYITALITTNRLPAAIKAGAKDLLLAPSDVPEYMGDGTGYIGAQWIPKYADLLADFINQFKQRSGILINWTGIANEPTSHKKVSFRLTQWAPMIKALRVSLNGRGLQAVKILAPETSQASAEMDETDTGGILTALSADPAAWSQLDAVGTHTYGIGANPEVRPILKNKPWWVTESGSLVEQLESPGDALQAATVSSRFLGDVNNGVTNWQFFIGTEYKGDYKGAVNSSNLMYYAKDPFKVVVFDKLYYLRALSEAFDVGAVFRHCQSDQDGHMAWGDGKKPHISVAFAKNPDGSYGIGVSNFTSDTFANPKQWLAANRGDTEENEKWVREQGDPAATYSVTIKVPELAGAVRFKAFRCNSGVHGKLLGEIVAKDGLITVPNVGPLDLVTLRSAK
ncbi:MAG TPA: hypothetical protein VG944_02510 [Fimbriimonas sp.]|nr:hypothetical protein [Fimbriimonas sp.]